MSILRRLVCSALFGVLCGLPIPASAAEPGCPLLIAHRGASGERPEHTLEAYALAIRQGADFIEVDLVPTLDGLLIARHENALAVVELDEAGQVRLVEGAPVVIEATTNVAAKPEFRDRLGVKLIDGRPVGGWFSEDFTHAEIRTLRARERMPGIRPGNTRFDDRFGVPTFAEVLDLAGRHGVGVYPELKHYTYFLREALSNRGQPIRQEVVKLLVQDLKAAGHVDPARLFIQSFEVEPLLRLKAMATAGEIPAWPLVQLAGPADAVPYDLVLAARDRAWNRVSSLFDAYGGEPRLLSYGALMAEPMRLRASHADGVGPAWQALRSQPTLTGQLQQGGLKVHTYTLRTEAVFLPDGVTFPELASTLFELGVDGVFTDQIPDVIAAREGCPSVR